LKKQDDRRHIPSFNQYDLNWTSIQGTFVLRVRYGKVLHFNDVLLLFGDPRGVIVGHPEHTKT
jgi:hypothetical protein